MITLTVSQLREQVGQELVVGDWLEVTQDRINRFADTIEDRQWIHVDSARAAVESPYKTTIAHGFLILSLISLMLRSSLTIIGAGMAINYGLNRVRFITPVPSGSRVRGRFTLAGLEEFGGSTQITWTIAVELEVGQKPACVAEWLVRYYPA